MHIASPEHRWATHVGVLGAIGPVFPGCMHPHGTKENDGSRRLANEGATNLARHSGAVAAMTGRILCFARGEAIQLAIRCLCKSVRVALILEYMYRTSFKRLFVMYDSLYDTALLAQPSLCQGTSVSRCPRALG